MIKSILVRLFIFIPINIILMIATFTIVAPVLYWVITGKLWMELIHEVEIFRRNLTE